MEKISVTDSKKGIQSTVKESRSYLRELGPVKGFVALEELSCQVAVLPVHFLQSRSMGRKWSVWYLIKQNQKHHFCI